MLSDGRRAALIIAQIQSVPYDATFARARAKISEATAPISERELRQALLAHLAARPGARSNLGQHVLIQEMGIERGLNRIDVAVVGEGLTGFEIKSDFDVPDRLATQIHAFNRVFGHINLVVSARTASDYAAIIPRWWGLWVADRTSGDPTSISIHERRSADKNRVCDAMSIVSLLRSDEVLTITARYAGLHRVTRRASKRELGRRLTELLTVDELALAVAAALRQRFLCPVAPW